jgi:hypothetical protein
LRVSRALRCTLTLLLLCGPKACDTQAAIEVLGPYTVQAAATSYSEAVVQVQQFDPSLGTLNSISVVASGAGNLTQFFENLGPSAGQLLIGQSLQMVLEMPEGTTPILSLNQVENHSYSFGPFDGAVDFGGTSGGTSRYAVTASGQGTIASTGGLAQFTGTGLADLILNAEGQISLPSGLAGGNLIVGGELTAGAEFTIQYDYTAVPEASTWLGAAAALVGLMFGSWPARAARALQEPPGRY